MKLVDKAAVFIPYKWIIIVNIVFPWDRKGIVKFAVHWSMSTFEKPEQRDPPHLGQIVPVVCASLQIGRTKKILFRSNIFKSSEKIHYLDSKAVKNPNLS